MDTALDLLTIGDCSLDVYMTVDKRFASTEPGKDIEHPKICFVHGTKIPIENCVSGPAGNACHVAVGCAKLGLKTAVYTELGADGNASRFTEVFEQTGVDDRFCIKNPGTETNIHAVVVYGRERTIFSYHKERNYKMYPWKKPKWLFYSTLAKGYESFQTQLVEYIKQNAISVVFNPGTQQIISGTDHFKSMLQVTGVLISNKEEAQMITNLSTHNKHELLRALHNLGPQVVVITDGESGSVAYDGQSFAEVAAYKKDTMKLVEKTGAGDAYTAGMLAAMNYGLPLKTAMMWGSINSAYVIQEVGGLKGQRTKAKIEQLV